MRQFEEYENVFFVGIGGIGMSALARFFHTAGYKVGGYDRTPGPVTDALSGEGIPVIFNEDVNAIPEAFKDNSRTLVVFTPAVPSGQRQMLWFRSQGFEVMKRSQVLGMITEDMQSIGVAGTHGKTTVSVMTAFLFFNSKLGINAFLGGISKNFRTNFLGNSEAEFVVLEADEFDRSFWQLSPYTALITSMDADHLDIYGTRDEVQEGFFGFAARIRENGILLIKAGLPLPVRLAAGVKVYTYALNQEADYRVCNLREKNGIYTFDMHTPRGVLNDFTLGVPGLVNVENAAAALTLALMNGVEYEEAKEALPRFQGIARRYDVIINSPRLVYIDDYAHHPEEIRATLKSVRDAHPGRRITGIFQPHLYSRTRDFAKGFADAFSEGLDQIILLPVYPAREEPLPGVTSELIAGYIGNDNCLLMERDELVSKLDDLCPDVLITMGAGDIDRIVPDIKEWGNKKM